MKALKMTLVALVAVFANAAISDDLGPNVVAKDAALGVIAAADKSGVMHHFKITPDLAKEFAAAKAMGQESVAMKNLIQKVIAKGQKIDTGNDKIEATRVNPVAAEDGEGQCWRWGRRFGGWGYCGYRPGCGYGYYSCYRARYYYGGCYYGGWNVGGYGYGFGYRCYW